jgi:L-alanine-DL-glutamate epimerase-like enolase superfamily enzyme
MGWGSGGGTCLAEEIAAVLRPQLIGENLLNREQIYHKLVRADRWRGHLPITAHGPIDVALWDITARKAGMPLYQLIGGYRDR